MLIRGGSAALVEGASGMMLGAFDATEYGLTTTRLEPGDVLLLYTDGIVERRGQDLGAGMEALVQAAHMCAGDDPEELISCLLKRLGGENAEDDICLLAAKVL